MTSVRALFVLQPIMDDVQTMRMKFSLILCALACVYGSPAVAASFPPLIDIRGSIEPFDFDFAVNYPEVIAPESDYAELIPIGDIDNDGLQDYQFQVFTEDFIAEYLNPDATTEADCPPLYIAPSSIVGSSFSPAEAIEIQGLDTFIDPAVNPYACLTSYFTNPQVIPDINDDQVNEILFQFDYLDFIDEAESPIGSVLVFGNLESGTVIDIANVAETELGITFSSGLGFQSTLGDINGDGIDDPTISINRSASDEPYYLEPYYGESDYRVINGAALATVNSLSYDTFGGDNVLIDIRSDSTASVTQMTGGADFNGDSYGDLVVTTQADETTTTYVIYGASDLNIDTDASLAGSQLNQFFACHNLCNLSLAGDFNADGFDDVILSTGTHDENQPTQNLIMFGGNDGLADEVEPNSSTIIDSSGPSGFESSYLSAVGDINADGASDLYFSGWNNDTHFVLLGQLGVIPETIVIDRLDGENGFQIFASSDYFYGDIVMVDADDDGIDDLVSSYSNIVMLKGRAISDNPVGVQGLSVATGHTITYLSWTAPINVNESDKVEVFVNDVLVDSVDAKSAYYQFDQPAPDSSAVLRVQYVNSESQTSPSIDVPLSNPFQALRQLRAVVYGETSVELTWESEPSDYVVWRNGRVLSRVSGNSYFDSDVRPGVEYRYHVTQGSNADGLSLGRSITLPEEADLYGCYDYCIDDAYYSYYIDECRQFGVIDNRSPALRSRYPASTDQLLVVTDASGTEFSTPAVDQVDTCGQVNDFRVVSGGYQLYSKTALELFWQRSTHPSGVVAYEISLFDELLKTVDATSYFVDGLGDEVLIEYKVTAIAGDGTRSIPYVYSIYLPENDQNYVDLQNTPPAAANVSVEVYSSSAAELFWDAEYDYLGYQVKYRISRNGEVLLTTDALSYFDDTLLPATAYSYEVIAISEAGVYGEASVVQLSTPSDNGADDLATNDGVLPTGARGQIYSNSALEIFWDRSSDQQISNYLIFRDDSQIDSIDGNTFYDSGLNPETEYRYAIQATDNNGLLVGQAAIVVLRTNR